MNRMSGVVKFLSMSTAASDIKVFFVIFSNNVYAELL